MNPVAPHSVVHKSQCNVIQGDPIKNVRVLFIVPPYRVSNSRKSSNKGVRSVLAFPYGVLTLATYIRQYARCLDFCEVLDLNTDSQAGIWDRIDAALRGTQPSIVAISLMFDVSYQHISSIADRIKAFNERTLIVMGGAAVTASYAEILSDQPKVDALCYSEGERALRRLIDADDVQRELQANPWVTRESIAAGRVPHADYIESLDVVVDIDYSLIDIAAYSMKEAFSPFAAYRNDQDVRQFFSVTSRGCPFECVFCAEPSYHGRAMRYASVDAVVAHVKSLIVRYGLNVLTIYDDQLLLDRPRAKELFRRLSELTIRVEMPNGVTAIFIDDELAGLMKAAGVDSVFLALESGSERVLKQIIRKPIRLDKIGPIIQNLHKHDIFVQAFFITGLPGEREEDRQTTWDFIRSHDIDWSLFNFATPLRGTELYRICKDNEWIDKRYLGIGNVDTTEYIIRAPGIDPDHIHRQTYMMNLDVNFVNNRRMRIKDYKTAIRCFEEVIDRHPSHAFAHYYLARALELDHREPAEVHRHDTLFRQAVTEDATWLAYAQHFGLLDRDVSVSAPSSCKAYA